MPKLKGAHTPKSTSQYMQEHIAKHGGPQTAPPVMAIAPADVVHPPKVTPLKRGVHTIQHQKSAAEGAADHVIVVNDKEQVIYSGTPKQFDVLKSILAGEK